MTTRALSVGDYLGRGKTETYAVKGIWRAKAGNGHPTGRGRTWEGTLQKRRKAQALPLEEVRGTGPMLGGEGLISQRMEMGVMAKQPETSYCWGPISQWKMGKGTP